MRKMKLFVGLLPAFMILFLSSVYAADKLQVSNILGINYEYFEDDRDRNATGQLFYIPLYVKGQYGPYHFGLIGAYANADYEGGEGEGDASLSTFLDTKLNFAYVLDTELVGLKFGLDLNLPTGKTELDPNELKAEMDPDLISIFRFGEGWNINPYIAAASEFGDFLVGLGVGYLYRGEYDPLENISDYDPGDMITVNLNGRYLLNQAYLEAFFQFTWYDDDKLDDRDFFKEGPLYIIGVGGECRNLDPFIFEVKIWDLIRGKNEFLNESGRLEEEDHNSNGNEFHVDLGATYAPGEKYSINATFNFMYIDENGYPSDNTGFFKGKRFKYSFGLGGAYKLTEQWVLSGKGTFFYLDDEKNPVFPDEELNYYGFTVACLVNFTF